MGLLFLCDSLHTASELWLHRMIEVLEPHVTLIGAARTPDARWRERVPVVSINVPRERLRDRLVGRLGLGWLAGRDRSRELERLRAIVESDRVDRVLVHYLTLALRAEPVWHATDVPLFVHCHGYDVTWDLRHHRYPHRPAYDSTYIEAAHRLSRRAIFIANSRTTARRLTDIGIPASRVAVKYMGVPVPENFPERAPRTTGLTVLYLGRLVDCKGPDKVIRAFDTACARGLDGTLMMAGDGPLRSRCERERARSVFRERIQMLGAVDPATGQRLRREADIFTAHSLRGPVTNQEEAFGVTFAEAMADGLPVVSGRSGSLPELIEHRRDGILVDPGDVPGHADVLVELSRSPELRRRLGEAAWRKAGDLYSQQRERQRLLDILDIGPAV